MNKMAIEEKELLKDFEQDRLKPVKNVKAEKRRYQRYASNTLLKNKRINIRLSERDLIHIQRKAVEQGMPYQTLIASIIHRYISK
ncbi:MAG: antitoxin [bacterium]|nr:antitoxin [bacterium]